MKLITFLLLLVGINANFYNHETCNKVILETGFRVYSCKKVDWWTNEEEHVSFKHKKYTINPFSPNRIWLNVSQVPVGMSSKDAFVILVDEGDNMTNATLISTTMTRILNGDETNNDVYLDKKEIENQYNDEQRYDGESTGYEMYFYIFDYYKNNTLNHLKIKDVVKLYYEDEDTVGDWGLADLAQFDESHRLMPPLPYICNYKNGTKVPVKVDVYKDLTHVIRPEGMTCNVDIIEMVNLIGYSEPKMVSKITERYGV